MSEVKVNKISPRTNCGTVTLGDSGDSFVIPAGATITNNGTQSGFGRSGSVNWQTSIKTATFTAVSGEGYFCNTSGGAFTLNLPSSPSVGDIVALKDYASSFEQENLTIGRGGSNLNGDAADSVRSTSNESLTLVYADATKGWLAVEEGTGFIGEQFLTATGGNATVTSGDYKIHVFTSPGTFTVTEVGTGDRAKVDYVVVAGGGGGGSGCAGAGGGAGGYRESYTCAVSGPYTASPLASGTSLTVTAQGYPITVGGGGAAAPASDNPGSKGADSVFSTKTSTGGGFGGGSSNQNGGPGGSGGGGGHATGNGGNGNDPSTSPAQGTNGANGNSPGGSGPGDTASGGGGAGGASLNAPSSPVQGGPGVTTQMVTATYGVSTPTPGRGFASGGGGGVRDRGDGATPNQGGPNPNSPPNAGLLGGAGGGGYGPYPNPTAQASGDNGTDNTGGGGGGGARKSPSGYGTGGVGGSGIVMIRYKFQ